MIYRNLCVTGTVLLTHFCPPGKLCPLDRASVDPGQTLDLAHGNTSFFHDPQGFISLRL